ncbi:MAG: Lrp/AsnC family transcriptional regulator [Desulfobacterales bacterium]|nr:Lrp/AsnC family transcriptional regulator [Desulfobacteraceae bacterium]MDY0311637.1 Lrp/AsnC family transcriptional regulator [Desulfobacterales bacterium]
MLDAVSFKILKILQEKARIPNVEVARQVGMAPSAVLERIRKLERQGFIDGYEVRLNPERFGRRLVAFVTVTTAEPEVEPVIGQRLAAIPDVQEVHFVAGQDSYLIKVRCADTRALDHLLREKIAVLAGVVSTRTAIALTTLKETARISIDPSEEDV